MKETRNSWLWIGATIILSALIGALMMYSFGPRLMVSVPEKIVEKPIIIQGETTHTQTNRVEYVAKEIDPATGKLEQTDAEYQINPPQVVVKVNGESQALDLVTGESRKFEKGKLLFEHSSKSEFAIKMPTIDQTKKRSSFYGWRSDGKEEITYSQNVTPRWGWYIGADGELLQEAVKRDSMKLQNFRGGIKVNF